MLDNRRSAEDLFERTVEISESIEVIASDFSMLFQKAHPQPVTSEKLTIVPTNACDFLSFPTVQRPTRDVWVF